MQAVAELASLVKSELAADVLLASGSLRFRATGFSMLPAIRPGDVLVIHRRKIEEIDVGEIAFFSCYGGVVAHRVKETGSRIQSGTRHARSADANNAETGEERKNPGCFLVTQGDTTPSPDPPVAAENLLGVVVAVERDGRPVDPRFTVYRQAIAWVLRRSTFALRVWMRIYRRGCEPRTVPALTGRGYNPGRQSGDSR